MGEKVLSEDGKQDVALALIFLRDFKSEGRFDVDVSASIFEIAAHLGVAEQYNQLLSKVPPMRVVPRA